MVDIASILPQFMEEVEDVAHKSFPTVFHQDVDNPYTSHHPQEVYEELQASCHQIIDLTFDTNQAQCYAPEAKLSQHDWDEHVGKQIGILPPPGMLRLSALKNTKHLAITEVSSIRGWKVGQPSNNRTAFGGIPKWSTVRKRHWKNKAFDHKNGKVFEKLEYQLTEENISRMERGLAPKHFNRTTGKMESMELDHVPPQRDGGRFDFEEVTPEQHADRDKYRYLGKN